MSGCTHDWTERDEAAEESCAICMRAEIARLRAELDEAKESLHYANGTCDLAIQHRDVAEAAACGDAEGIALLRLELQALADRMAMAVADARAALAPRPEGKGE